MKNYSGLNIRLGGFKDANRITRKLIKDVIQNTDILAHYRNMNIRYIKFYDGYYRYVTVRDNVIVNIGHSTLRYKPEEEVLYVDAICGTYSYLKYIKPESYVVPHPGYDWEY